MFKQGLSFFSIYYRSHFFILTAAKRFLPMARSLIMFTSANVITQSSGLIQTLFLLVAGVVFVAAWCSLPFIFKSIKKFLTRN